MSAAATVFELNGESRPLAPGTTVAAVVHDVVDSPAGLAVALNGEVVARSRWSTTPVGAGDRLELLCAAPGG